MARKNLFKDQETDFLSMLDEESSEDNLTKSIARQLEEKSDFNNEILTAPTDMFIPYADEKLRLDLHSGEDRDRLKESIRLNGIFTPVICVKKDNKLMILSGHNRVDVAKELGIEVPYILKDDLSNEEMELICIDDNLIHRQRTDYKPMQLAYSIKVKMDAERHQGVASSNGYSKMTGDKIGEEHGLTRKMINIYLKLNELIDEAKKLVDQKTISIRLGYELAFLDSESQQIILNYLNTYKINEKIVKSIRNNIKDKTFTSFTDKKIFIESQLLQLRVTVTQSRKLDYNKIRKNIPENIKEEDILQYIIDAIKFYNEMNTK